MQAIRKALSKVPTPHDFLPSRFPRKLSMVVGWAVVAMVVVLIVDVSLRTWLTAHATELLVLPRGGTYNVSVTGQCSLGWCRFHRVSTPSFIDEDVAGSPSDLTRVEKLTPYGAGVKVLFVVLIIASPIVALFCFIHGWSRTEDQRISYVIAAGSLLIMALLSMAAFVVYGAATPEDGYSVGSAFWLNVVVFIVYIALTVVVCFDKPMGLFRLSKTGVVPEQSWESTVAASGQTDSAQSGTLHAALLPSETTDDQ